MRPHLLRVALSLALGALAALVVAWGFAAGRGARFAVGQQFASLHMGSSVWQIEARRGAGFAIVRSSALGGGPAASLQPLALLAPPAAPGAPGDDGAAIVPPWSRPRRGGGPGGSGASVIDAAWGWPMLALRYEAEASPWTPSVPAAMRGAIPLGDTGRGLPLIPITRGFAIDALFYTVLLLVTWEFAALVRGGARRRRGTCPRCGYDLRDDLAAGCPECGWARSEGALGAEGHP